MRKFLLEDTKLGMVLESHTVALKDAGYPTDRDGEMERQQSRGKKEGV